jgi:hypothetical protein
MEAAELGHQWVEPSHFVLAMTRPGDESLAGEALRACSVSHEGYAAEFKRWLADVRPSPPASDDHEREITPATYQMMGRAEGIAAGVGSPEVRAEHVLLAILWESFQIEVASILANLGVTREDLRNRLFELGAAPQSFALPRLREEPRWGEEVFIPVEQLSAVSAELPLLLVQAGATFRFWGDGTRVKWVKAPEGIDLQKYIAFAVDAWSRRKLPCSCCGYVTLDVDPAERKRPCDVCYWIDDPAQTTDWEFRGGANDVTLVEAQRNFRLFGASQDRFKDNVRPPRPEEIPPSRSAPAAE